MRARVISSLFLLMALASPGLAADRHAEGGQSFDRILPEIRRHTPGTFYDAEGPFFGQDGQARYRIKWMTPDGRIIWFDADARSGRVLGAVPYPGGRYGGDRFNDDSYGRDRYDDRYDDDRNTRDRRDNSNHFGGWPGYDRGQGDRDSHYGDRGDRGRRDGDGGNARRGGSDHGYSGRGDSRRGHRN